MKFLVDEITLETLNNARKHFLKENEITFLEYADAEKYGNEVCPQPFYIEEKIANLEALLQTLADMEYGRKKLPSLSWIEFVDFYLLMSEIQKFRDVGEKLSDLEYVYRMTKEMGNVEYGEGDEGEELRGKSRIVEFTVTSEECGGDFIFDFSWKRERLGKIEIKSSHYHPITVWEVLEDVKLWLANDPIIARRYGIKVK